MNFRALLAAYVLGQNRGVATPALRDPYFADKYSLLIGLFDFFCFWQKAFKWALFMQRLLRYSLFILYLLFGISIKNTESIHSWWICQARLT